MGLCRRVWALGISAPVAAGRRVIISNATGPCQSHCSSCMGERALGGLGSDRAVIAVAEFADVRSKWITADGSI